VFDAIKALDNTDTNLEIAALDIKNGNADKEEINRLLADPKTLFDVQKILTAQKETALLKNSTDEQIAASALMKFTHVDVKTQTATLSEKREVVYNGRTVSFYFYKIKKTTDDTYGRNQERLAAIAFINNGDRINAAAYKNAGGRRITGSDSIEDIKKAMIDATLNADKQRATFGKRDDRYNEDFAEEMD